MKKIYDQLKKVGRRVAPYVLTGALLQGCSRSEPISIGSSYWNKDGEWTTILLDGRIPKPAEVVDFYPCDGLIDGVRNFDRDGNKSRNLSQIVNKYKGHVDSTLIGDNTEDMDYHRRIYLTTNAEFYKGAIDYLKGEGYGYEDYLAPGR